MQLRRYCHLAREGRSGSSPFCICKPVDWLKWACVIPAKLLWCYGCVPCLGRIWLVISRLQVCEAVLGYVLSRAAILPVLCV